MPPPSPTAKPFPLVLALTATLFAICFGVITWQVLVHDVHTHDLGGLLTIDPRISGWAIEHRTGVLTATAHTVSLLGATLTMTILGTIACAFLLRTGDRPSAALVAVTGFGAAVIVFACKRLIGRERPPVADRLAYEPSLSYPSGHSLGSSVVIAVCAAVFLPRLERHAARIIAGALAAVFVLAVGWSRVYLGVHWPTDVLGAWCAGIAWIALCLTVFRLRRPPPSDLDRRPTAAADTSMPG